MKPLAQNNGDLTHVVKELRTSVPLNIVTVEVTPTKLNINPELVAGRSVENVLAL